MTDYRDKLLAECLEALEHNYYSGEYYDLITKLKEVLPAPSPITGGE